MIMEHSFSNSKQIMETPIYPQSLTIPMARRSKKELEYCAILLKVGIILSVVGALALGYFAYESGDWMVGISYALEQIGLISLLVWKSLQR